MSWKFNFDADFSWFTWPDRYLKKKKKKKQGADMRLVEEPLRVDLFLSAVFLQER